MRQIIILLLTVIVTTAAPSNRREVVKQLNQVVAPKMGNLQGFNMTEMVEILGNLSENKINFIWMPHLVAMQKKSSQINTNSPAQPLNGGGILPNNIGGVQQLPVAKKRAEPVIRVFAGELNNLTLKQVLDFTTMSMQPPVQYMIMDYGVIFYPRAESEVYTPTRIFRLNGNPFR
jgi:hypothetical protein